MSWPYLKLNFRGLPRNLPWLKLVGPVLLVIILWRVDFRKVILVSSAANKMLIVVVIITIPLLVLLKTFRWQVFMFSQDIHYSMRNAYLSYWSSMLIGFFTPGRLGEFVKAMHIINDCGVPPGRAVSSVLSDRVFDLYFLVMAGSAALVALSEAEIELIIAIGLALFLTVLLVLFINNRSFAWLQYFGLRSGLFGEKVFTEGWLVELRDGLRRLTRPWLLVAATLTIMAYGLFFIQCYLLALALRLPAGFMYILYAVAAGNLVALLPISISGLGTRDAAIIGCLSKAAVPAEAALGFSLLIFFSFYLVGGLMGAIAWWIKPLVLTNIPVRSNSLASESEMEGAQVDSE